MLSWLYIRDLNLPPIRFVQFVPQFVPRCRLYSFIISMFKTLKLSFQTIIVQWMCLSRSNYLVAMVTGFKIRIKNKGKCTQFIEIIPLKKRIFRVLGHYSLSGYTSKGRYIPIFMYLCFIVMLNVQVGWCCRENRAHSNNFKTYCQN